MVENLKRLREPAAWIVLIVTVVSIVLALIRFGVGLTAGMGFAEASQTLGLSVMNLTLVVLVVALVWTCVFVEPTTPRAARLVSLSAAAVTLGTGLTLFGAIAGLTAINGALAIVLEFVGGLLDIVVKGVGAVTLWLIHRGVRAGRIAPVAPPEESADAPTAAAAGTADGASATGWSADASSGRAWASASDAAAGAPATGNGGSGLGAGWHAVAREGDDSAEGTSSGGLTKGE